MVPLVDNYENDKINDDIPTNILCTITDLAYYSMDNLDHIINIIHLMFVPNQNNSLLTNSFEKIIYPLFGPRPNNPMIKEFGNPHTEKKDMEVNNTGAVMYVYSWYELILNMLSSDDFILDIIFFVLPLLYLESRFLF
jgi:hypothetical protein